MKAVLLWLQEYWTAPDQPNFNLIKEVDHSRGIDRTRSTSKRRALVSAKAVHLQQHKQPAPQANNKRQDFKVMSSRERIIISQHSRRAKYSQVGG
jgi:hypothetical protein